MACAFGREQRNASAREQPTIWSPTGTPRWASAWRLSCFLPRGGQALCERADMALLLATVAQPCASGRGPLRRPALSAHCGVFGAFSPFGALTVSSRSVETGNVNLAQAHGQCLARPGATMACRNMLSNTKGTHRAPHRCTTTSPSYNLCIHRFFFKCQAFNSCAHSSQGCTADAYVAGQMCPAVQGEPPQRIFADAPEFVGSHRASARS